MTLAIAHKSTGVIPYVILQYEELKSKIQKFSSLLSSSLCSFIYEKDY